MKNIKNYKIFNRKILKNVLLKDLPKLFLWNFRHFSFQHMGQNKSAWIFVIFAWKNTKNQKFWSWATFFKKKSKKWKIYRKKTHQNFFHKISAIFCFYIWVRVQVLFFSNIFLQALVFLAEIFFGQIRSREWSANTLLSSPKKLGDSSIISLFGICVG